jgi:hypothetical protein
MFLDVPGCSWMFLDVPCIFLQEKHGKTGKPHSVDPFAW